VSSSSSALLARVEALEQQIAVLTLDTAALRGRVVTLEAIEADRKRRRLHRDDPPFLARLLPALSGAWGSSENFVRDVVDDPRLGRLTRGRNVLALGKLFARAVGVPIGDYVLVDCGLDPVEGVRRYRVEGVDHHARG
jgi:hypothetical protein